MLSIDFYVYGVVVNLAGKMCCFQQGEVNWGFFGIVIHWNRKKTFPDHDSITKIEFIFILWFDYSELKN